MADETTSAAPKAEVPVSTSEVTNSEGENNQGVVDEGLTPSTSEESYAIDPSFASNDVMPESNSSDADKDSMNSNANDTPDFPEENGNIDPSFASNDVIPESNSSEAENDNIDATLNDTTDLPGDGHPQESSSLNPEDPTVPTESDPFVYDNSASNHPKIIPSVESSPMEPFSTIPVANVRDPQPYDMSTSSYPNVIPREEGQDYPSTEPPSDSTPPFGHDRDSQPYNLSSSSYPNTIPVEEEPVYPTMESSPEYQTREPQPYNLSSTSYPNVIPPQPEFDFLNKSNENDPIHTTNNVADNADTANSNADASPSRVYGDFTNVYDPFAATRATNDSGEPFQSPTHSTKRAFRTDAPHNLETNAAGASFLDDDDQSLASNMGRRSQVPQTSSTYESGPFDSGAVDNPFYDGKDDISTQNVGRSPEPDDDNPFRSNSAQNARQTSLGNKPNFDHDAPAAAPGTGYERMDDDDDHPYDTTYALVVRPPDKDEDLDKGVYKDSDLDYDGYGDYNSNDMYALTVYEEDPFIDPDEEVDGLHKDEDEDRKLQDDEEPLDKKKKRKCKRRKIFTRRDADNAKKDKRRNRRCCWLILCLLCCLLIALVIWLILRGGKDEEDPEAESDDDPNDPYDDDFVVRKPFENITTTPFDPFVEDECDFANNDIQNPHVINQCLCSTEPKYYANDTVALYEKVKEEVSRFFYDGELNETIESCTPENQAMVWLSSGNTRDGGDFYQRYISALTYIQMNGTNWDVQNLWMSDESECIWLGLQCNANRGINSIGLDAINLQGSLPTEISHMSSLRAITMTRNHVSGTVPTEYFSMPQLEKIILYTNNMIGSIPSEVGLATNLQTLKLENNLLFGMLVTEIGLATSLEYLSIGFNEFWQKIPTELGLLTNLKGLNIEENRFSGTLPTELGRLSNMEYFLMSKNLLNGPIPEEFASMSNMLEYRAAHSGIGGTIPVVLASSLLSLNRLELGANNFVGTIMTELGLMTGLSWLGLNENDFRGPIPTELGNLVNMTRLSFKDNLLTGSIPTEFGLMTGLHDLSLDLNTLTGVAPQEVCELRQADLQMFVTDCPSRGGAGVDCPIGDCCSFCRRGKAPA